jgi:uncharacterized protein YjbI with pentapeptide repeats
MKLRVLKNTPVTPEKPKTVVKVEILHLDELGYGPQGKHTRREWRKECLDNLLAGKAQFEAWQASWKDQIDKDLPNVSLAATLHYEGGTKEIVLGDSFEDTKPFTLDFVVLTFATVVDASKIIFEQNADFSSATFTGKADFSSATLSGRNTFQKAIFENRVALKTQFSTK